MHSPMILRLAHASSLGDQRLLETCCSSMSGYAIIDMHIFKTVRACQDPLYPVGNPLLHLLSGCSLLRTTPQITGRGRPPSKRRRRAPDHTHTTATGVSI